MPQCQNNEEMTNAEIKLVVKALCIALGDEDRCYGVKVSDKGIEIEYIVSIESDSEPDPQIAKDPEITTDVIHIPLITNLPDLVERIKVEIEDTELVEIKYKKF